MLESEQISVTNTKNSSLDNLNPFHHDFNKVIENPFLKSQEMLMTTDITDDNESQVFAPNLRTRPSRPEETVNKAILNIYDSNKGCDPFLKMRVSFFLNYK